MYIKINLSLNLYSILLSTIVFDMHVFVGNPCVGYYLSSLGEALLIFGLQN